MKHRIRNRQTACLTCPTHVFELTSGRRALTVKDLDEHNLRSQRGQRARRQKTTRTTKNKGNGKVSNKGKQYQATKGKPRRKVENPNNGIRFDDDDDDDDNDNDDDNSNNDCQTEPSKSLFTPRRHVLRTPPSRGHRTAKGVPVTGGSPQVGCRFRR